MIGDISNEYVSSATQFFELAEDLLLDSGETLSDVRVAYRTWGDPKARARLVCHALTANADADEWWAGLFGSGRTLDPDRDFIVATNILGSCYGTTGPRIADASGRPLGPDFPVISVRDMVRLQSKVIDQLGVESLEVVIGGSLGGMQALEWAALFPDRVESVVAIGVGAAQSAMCMGLSEAQRQAITSDPAFLEGRYPQDAGPDNGLALARMIAMVTYRSRENFEQRFGRDKSEDVYEIQSYLRYQGKKLVERFDANTYLTLMGAMDSFDLGHGRGSIREVLRSIVTPVLAIAISSDVLHPPAEVEELATGLPNSVFKVIDAPQGHDAFLIETDQINQAVSGFAAG